MLNWILQYSFTQACPLIEHTLPTTPFAPAKAQSNHIYAVQVWDDSQLVGFYIMKHTEADLHLLYLYYDAAANNKVFASIIDHAKHMRIEQVTTDNRALANHIRKNIYFPKYNVLQVHFAYPASFHVPQEIILQYGDGDNFSAE